MTESALALTLDEYEERIINEIAHHIVSPNRVRQALALAGKPAERVLSYAASSKLGPIRKAGELVTAGVQKALETSIEAAARISSDAAICASARELGLEVATLDDLPHRHLSELDKLADTFDRGHSIALGAEGALLGAATSLAQGIPFAQLLIPGLIAIDVSSSITLLSRHTGCIAASYGYSPRIGTNRFHLIAAMAPPSETPDEGYFTAKLAAVESIREAGAFMLKAGDGLINRRLATQNAPRLVQLLQYVAGRLGIILTEKELGMLVPIAGAVLNGGLNVAFQKMGHTYAKDYFRILHLENRYGSDVIREKIRTAIQKIS